MNINFTFTYDKRITDKEKENDSEAAVYIQCTNKNVIRDGGNTALYAAYTIDIVDMVYTVYTGLDWFTLLTLFILFKLLFTA